MALDRITVTNNFNTPSGLVLGLRDFTFVSYIFLQLFSVKIATTKKVCICLHFCYVHNPLKASLQHNTSAV